MIRKAASALALLAVVLLPSGSVALGLGGIEVTSTLNEPLNARIDLRSLSAADAEGMRISLGSSAQFERAGIERPFYLSGLRFEVVPEKAGRGHIAVTTAEPVNEPFLNFLVEVNWPRGRVIREYTVLLDPPVYGSAITRTGEKTVETVPAESLLSLPQSSPTQPSTGQAAAATSQRRALRGSLSPGAGNTYGMTGKMDTLWSIANRTRPDSSVSIQRMMLAILAANPEAFSINNVNALRAGYVLQIPSLAEANKISQREALTEIRRQHAEWEEYRQQLGAPPAAAAQPIPQAAPPAAVQPTPQAASVAAPDATSEGQRPTAESLADTPSAEQVGSALGDDGTLRLVAPATGDGRAADSAAIGEQLQVLRDELSLAQEDADSQRQQTAALESRLGQAENLVDDLQRLVQLKDDAIAQLQRELEKAQADLARAAEPTQPVPIAQGEQQSVAQQPAQPKSPAVAKEPSQQTGPAPEQRQAAAQKPQAAPSFLDTIEEIIGVDPIIAGAGLGGVLLVGIGGFALARRRRRDAEDAFGEAVVLGAGAGAVAAVHATDAAAQDGPNIATEADGDGGAPGPIDTATQTVQPSSLNEEDPLAEVNVYLAYERYKHAEALVREAIEQNPERLDYRMRLLEVFHSAKDADAFRNSAADLRDVVGDEHPLMEQAQTWWEEISPGLPLFGAAAAAAQADAGTQGGALEDTLVEASDTLEQGGGGDASSSPSGETSVDFDLGFDAGSQINLSGDGQSAVDFDLGFGAEEEPVESGSPSGELDFDLGAREAGAGSMSNTESVDFDLGTGEAGTGSTSNTESVDFDLGTGEAGTDSMSNSGSVDFDLSTGEAGTASMSNSESIDFDLGEASDEGRDTASEEAPSFIDFELPSELFAPAGGAAEAEPELETPAPAEGGAGLEGDLSLDLDAAAALDSTLDIAERHSSEDDRRPGTSELDSSDVTPGEDTGDGGRELQFELDEQERTEASADAGPTARSSAAQGSDTDANEAVFEFNIEDSGELELAPDLAPSLEDARGGDELGGADPELGLERDLLDKTVSFDDLSIGFDLNLSDSDQGAEDSAEDSAASRDTVAPDLELDFDSEMDDHPAETTSIGLEQSVEDELAQSRSDTGVDTSDLDFDLSFGEEDAAAATRDSDSPLGDDSGLDLNLDVVDSFDSTSATSDSSLDLDLTLELDDADDQGGAVDTVRLTPETRPSEYRDADIDFEEIFSADASGTGTNSDLDFDLGADVDADDDQGNTLILGSDTGADSDEAQTKLDLARAYIDMEDFDGAKGVLGEVLVEGTEAQQKDARALLDKLS